MTTIKTTAGLPSPAKRDRYPAATDRMDFYAHTDLSSTTVI
ncbi:MAG: hypothetical protein NTV93_03575 [Verrucomicrobia bacterium]|nr:hypothetical protein [Verrucomicrobiota bacterium]